jgi:hypothetical protein
MANERWIEEIENTSAEDHGREDLPGRSAEPKLKPMKKSLRYTLLISLVSTLTVGMRATPLDEDSTPAKPAPSEPAPNQEQPDVIAPNQTPPTPAETERVTPPQPAPEEPTPAIQQEQPAPQDVPPPAPAPETEPNPPATKEVSQPPGETTPPPTPVQNDVQIRPAGTNPATPAGEDFEGQRAEPRALACKVIVVDRVAQTVTVEMNGKLHLLKITPQVRIMKKGKLVTTDEITSGQEIVLLARALPNGTYEVVSVAIGPNKAQSQAAGNAYGFGRGDRVKDNPPYFNFPNPANKLGPVISPNQ